MADEFDKLFENQAEEGDGESAEDQNVNNSNEQQQEQSQEANRQEQEQQNQENDWFKLDEFQNRFGVKDYGLEFENEDSIKSFFEKASNNDKKVQEYEQKVNDYESRMKSVEEEAQYYKEWASKFDLEKMFGSKEEAERYHLAKQLGKGRDQGVTNKVINSDPTQMSDLDVLSLKMQYNSPKLAGRDSEIKLTLLKKAGVDVDDPDFSLNNVSLTPDQEIDLAMQADEARGYLSGLKNKVEKPEFLSPSEQIQQRIQQDKERRDQLTKSWEDGAKRVASQIPDLKVDLNGTEFSYELDSKFKDGITKDIQESAVKRGLELNEENINKLANEALERYEFENRNKIYNAIAQEIGAKLTEKYDQKRHNTQPLNDNEKPDAGSENEDMAKINDYFGF